jgi:predicted ester cyclase
MNSMSDDDSQRVYQDFIAALNAQDLKAAAAFVDVSRYREDCVGFTGGFVDWPVATASLRKIWQGLPDLHVELEAVASDGAVVLAHGHALGTATGKLYGAPATGKSYRASFFDMVHVEDGLIVHRVQQADVLGQMRQLYGRALGALGTSALLWKL